MQHIDTSLQKKLDRMEQALKKKSASSPKKAEIIQLEIWAEPQRGTPNQVLRSALFAGIQGKQANYIEREKLISSQKGFEIRFTGKQLTQVELDVFQQALHLSRLQPLGTAIEFTATGFLKLLGRKTGGKDHEQLKDQFTRLTACALEITDLENNLTYGGSLLEFWRDENTGRMLVKFNPRMRKLFNKGWTAIDYEQRKKLKSKPLAQWLHLYISTHAKIHPMKPETFRELSGSKTKSIYHFKASLKKALEALKNIGAINSFYFESGLLYIDHTPSDTQIKHLSKKYKNPLGR